MRTDYLAFTFVVFALTATLTNFVTNTAATHNTEQVSNIMTLSKDDFLEYMGQLENKRQADREKDMDIITTRIKQGVREEVHSAVSSIVSRQDSLEANQSSLLDEQSLLKSRVSAIETVLADLKGTSTTSDKGPAPTPNQPQPRPAMSSSGWNNPDRLAESIITNTKAKNIVGFAPIDLSDIECLKKDKGLTSDAKAFKAAFVEFADGEMKVPQYILSNLSIVRIFTPKNPNSNLYVEFADQITADLIWSFNINLLPGRKVKLWVPPQFYERFRALTSELDLKNLRPALSMGIQILRT